MRVVFVLAMFYCLASSLEARPPVEFGAGGRVRTSKGVQRALDWPTMNTAYTLGDRFRVLFQMEIYRQQALHFDANVGEQFLGASVGATLGKLGLGNTSVLGGYGYDLDQSKFDFFAGISHRSTLFSLSSFKTFSGWDIVLDRVRYGLAYEMYEWEDYHLNLDLVGTSKIFGRRNFLGLGLGSDYFQGEGAGLEVDIGGFAGYDFDEVRSDGKKGDWGGGLMMNFRF